MAPLLELAYALLGVSSFGDALHIPLPDEGYRLTNLHFYQGKVGTVFEGLPQPDLTIAELLRKQAAF